MNKEDYDGLYFYSKVIEEEDKYGMDIYLFKIKNENPKLIENCHLGPKYHIVFLNKDENQVPFVEDDFEAILSDPYVYIKGLIGSNLSGCVLRKTEKSQEWWDKYVLTLKENCFLYKLKNNLT